MFRLAAALPPAITLAWLGCGSVTEPGAADASMQNDAAGAADAAEACQTSLIFQAGPDLFSVETDGSELRNLTSRPDDDQVAPLFSRPTAHSSPTGRSRSFLEEISM